VTFSFITFYFGFFGIQTTLLNVFFPIVAYVLGYSLNDKDNNYKKVYTVILMLVVFMTLFILLSYIKTLFSYGSLQVARDFFHDRALEGFSNGQELKATVVTIYLSFGLSILPTLFVR